MFHMIILRYLHIWKYITFYYYNSFAQKLFSKIDLLHFTLDGVSIQ